MGQYVKLLTNTQIMNKKHVRPPCSTNKTLSLGKQLNRNQDGGKFGVSRSSRQKQRLGGEDPQGSSSRVTITQLGAALTGMTAPFVCEEP